ncbi:hypothetical protein ART_4032 [Arthrobacter sp. PAMC 25486]|uniref:hypothetical protein n=1 Tax=Arthrobacter sp. PAMC 25486 TaxID=1494608 RepID=UPI000535F0B8|nr:hypothetical protein [Arthrobacter sp. PAMC 25486]AIY03631.1 hypothetical protein ART_4032 [Arthrobacter sp. PAMC 25486]
MSEIEQQNFATKPRNRRAVVKGAAWSVPVIAAAIAAPAASASDAPTGSLIVSTGNCNGVEIASNPEFVLTATGGDTAATSFTITSSKVVNAGLQNAWTAVGGITIDVLSGSTWTFTVPAMIDGQSVTLKSNAQLLSLLGSYTGTVVAGGSSKTMSLVLGLLGLVTICTTS